MVLVTICITFIIGIFWITDEYRRHEKEALIRYQSSININKELIQTEVQRIISFIEYKKSQRDAQLKQVIKEQAYGAHSIATNLFNQLQGKKSNDEIAEIIKTALRPIRFNDGRGYFFATDLNGIEQLFADRPELEGVNVIDMQDTNGKYVIRDMISLVKDRGEGFYEYTWTKPAQQRRDFPKIAFVKYFQPLDWFIGTGEYLDDVSKDLQAEVLQWISNARYGENGYFFVHTFDGINLNHADPKVVGKDVSALQDANGVKFIEELTRVSKNPEGGTLRYIGHYDPNSGKPGEKISFAMSVPEWQWVVGTGVYIDQLASLQLEHSELFRKNVQKSAIKIFAVLFLALFLIYLSVRYISQKVTYNFKVFDTFFKEAAVEGKPVELKSLDYDEFISLGESANRMLKLRKESEADKKSLEEQLRQAHKMEAIGTMAGGIAHDFNNILAAIIGYAEMAKLDTPEYSPAKYPIEQVLTAGNRAKELVRHILTFSRISNPVKDYVQIDLSSIVREVLRFQRSVIPSTIKIESDVSKNCCLVKGDPTQLHQVLMNLCTNAAHAMEEKGGTLSVTLSKTYCDDKELAEEPHVLSGTFVQLTVCDTGIGMTPEMLDRIFDPYFTTKEVGKGSGMGLAVVIGIVRNHGGFLRVESNLDEGSTFHVFIPVSDMQQSVDETNEKEEGLRGDETILFVDDEQMLTDIGKTMLEQFGYTVVASTKSTVALDLFRQSPKDYDMIITDQTMPDMTGSELARRFLAIRPDIPIILCTGFSNTVDEAKAKEMGVKGFIMKPVNMVKITKLMRRVFDQTSAHN